MSEISAVKKLDAVLEYLNDAKEPPFRNYAEITADIGSSMRPKELIEILHKLTEDKTCFQKIINNVVYYHSTFEGQLLESNKGYEAKFLADQAYADELLREKQRVVRVDNESAIRQDTLNSLTKRLAWAGWAAAIGTGFLGLMELVKLIPIYFPSCHCH